MPNLERYIYRKTGRRAEDIGRIDVVQVDPTALLAIRPYLNREWSGYRNKRRRSSPKIPEGISMDGDTYLVDGHHKGRRAIDFGIGAIFCRTLYTEDPVIKRKLEKIGKRPLGELEYR